jgi:hypothetical protein
MEDCINKYEAYTIDFEKKDFNIKKGEVIEIYFGPYCFDINHKNNIIFINNKYLNDFLSYFIKYGDYEIEKIIEIGEEYICLKENKLFTETIKQNDVIEIIDYDDFTEYDNTYGISVDINGTNNRKFWNKRIDKEIFKEYFLTKNKYRELRINKIL